jgi:hypothetical protein
LGILDKASVSGCIWVEEDIDSMEAAFENEGWE